MAAVNSIINKADYNTIRDSLVTIMGDGSGTSGWGQTARIKSSAVTESNIVTINEWANLRYDIINAHTHIYGTTPVTAQVSEGNTIRYSPTFTPDTGTIDTPPAQYIAWVNTLVANKWTVAAGQSATTSAVTSSREWPNALYGNTWSSKITCTINLTWSTAAQARYFFNSGGLIRITSSRANSTSSTLGSGNQQNISWTSILSTAGTRSFGGNTPGTGTTPTDAQNFYRLGNTYQVWYSATGSSPYSSNTYRISAKCNVTNNSAGTANSVDFLLEYIDNYTDPGPEPSPPPGDAVDGIFTVSASTLYATGVMVPSGTGNFTVETPTVTVSGIAPA